MSESLETHEEPPEIYSSRGLNPEETHMYEGPVSVVHLNEAHKQDAFAVAGNEEKLCAVVCDGVSGHPEIQPQPDSGPLALSLAEKLAEKGLGASLLDIPHDELQAILREAGKDMPKGNGATTLSVVSVDKETGDAEYLFLGDSPVFIVDTDDVGNVISWELVGSSLPVNQNTYADPSIIEQLKDHRTRAASIENEVTTLPDDFFIRRGNIKYKKGRKIVIASDFLTKMLRHDPKAALVEKAYWEHTQKAEDQKQKDDKFHYWNRICYRNENCEGEFWDKNGKFDPLVLHRIPAHELHDKLRHWISLNMKASDDVTEIVLDLEKLKKAA